MNLTTISYNSGHGFRGLGDFYSPENAEQKTPVLLIHGGGWGAMDKQGVGGIAEFLCGEPLRQAFRDLRTEVFCFLCHVPVSFPNGKATIPERRSKSYSQTPTKKVMENL